MRLRMPSRCELFGHRRKYGYRVVAMRADRRGVLRPVRAWMGRCTRCGAGEPTCYEPGWWERAKQFIDQARSWWHELNNPPPPRDFVDDDIPF